MTAQMKADDSNPRAVAEILRPALMRVSRKLRQEALKAGVSSLDALLLARIASNPGIGVSELADDEQISRPTMSNHVKKLEAAKLITRRQHAVDGRRSGFTITRAGARSLHAAQRQKDDWLTERLVRLSPQSRMKLTIAASLLMALLEIEK